MKLLGSSFRWNDNIVGGDGEIPAFAGIGLNHSSFPKYVQTKNEKKHYIICYTAPSSDSSEGWNLIIKQKKCHSSESWNLPILNLKHCLNQTIMRIPNTYHPFRDESQIFTGQCKLLTI